MAQSAPNQSYLQQADQKVRRTWEACQRQYLAALEKKAKVNTEPPVDWDATQTPDVTAVKDPEAGAVVGSTPVPDQAHADPGEDDSASLPVETVPLTKPVDVVRPRKPTAVEHKAIADRQSKREEERTKKRVAQESRQHELAEAVRKLNQNYCGEAPEKRTGSSVYRGLEDYFKERATGSESVQFQSCSEAVEKNPPTCWIVVCEIPAKSAAGAKSLQRYAFGKSTRGWKILEGP